MTHQQLAAIIKADPAFNSNIKMIRLDDCYAGKGGANSFAEHLAIDLGVTVRASDAQNEMLPGGRDMNTGEPTNGYAKWHGKVSDFEAGGTVKFVHKYP